MTAAVARGLFSPAEVASPAELSTGPERAGARIEFASRWGREAVGQLHPSRARWGRAAAGPLNTRCPAENVQNSVSQISIVRGVYVQNVPISCARMCVRTYVGAHTRTCACAQWHMHGTSARTYAHPARTHVRTCARAHGFLGTRARHAHVRRARAYVRACTLAHAQDKCAPSQSSHCHLWIKGGTHRAARHQFFCYVRPTYVSSRFACRHGIFRLPACFVDCQPEAMSLSGAKKRAITLDAERESIWDLDASPLNRAISPKYVHHLMRRILDEEGFSRFRYKCVTAIEPSVDDPLAATLRTNKEVQMANVLLAGLPA